MRPLKLGSSMLTRHGGTEKSAAEGASGRQRIPDELPPLEYCVCSELTPSLHFWARTMRRTINSKSFSSEASPMLSKTEMSAIELRAVAERIKSLRQQATEHAVEIGRELLRVKASLPHGAFIKWVEQACEFKIRTAQDLMKLAREADSNAQLVALMMPSTLRVYLSKTTPAAVRNSILGRLSNGERISRNELHSAVLAARSKKGLDKSRGELPLLAGPDLLTAGESPAECEGDRARRVAELLIRRLSKEDYDFVMEGMSWGVWNRVFVWLRAARGAGGRMAGPLPVASLAASSASTSAFNSR